VSSGTAGSPGERRDGLRAGAPGRGAGAATQKEPARVAGDPRAGSWRDIAAKAYWYRAFTPPQLVSSAGTGQLPEFTPATRKA